MKYLGLTPRQARRLAALDIIISLIRSEIDLTTELSTDCLYEWHLTSYADIDGFRDEMWELHNQLVRKFNRVAPDMYIREIIE
jgi:hypothetical protein